MYDEDNLIAATTNYYGETTFSMQYKNKQSQPFDWLYVDFDTLKQTAKNCNLNCELITKGLHYDFLVRIRF